VASLAGGIVVRTGLDLGACAAVLLHVDPPLWDDDTIRGLKVIERHVLDADQRRLAEQAATPKDPEQVTKSEYEAWVAAELQRRGGG